MASDDMRVRSDLGSEALNRLPEEEKKDSSKEGSSSSADVSKSPTSKKRDPNQREPDATADAGKSSTVKKKDPSEDTPDVKPENEEAPEAEKKDPTEDTPEETSETDPSLEPTIKSLTGVSLATGEPTEDAGEANPPLEPAETDPSLTVQNLLATDEPGDDTSETDPLLEPGETDPAVALQNLLGTNDPLTLDQLNSLVSLTTTEPGENGNETDLPLDESETDPALTLQRLLGTKDPLSPEQLNSLVSLTTAEPGEDGSETDLPLEDSETDPAVALQNLLGTDEPLTLEQINSLVSLTTNQPSEDGSETDPAVALQNLLGTDEPLTLEEFNSLSDVSLARKFINNTGKPIQVTTGEKYPSVTEDMERLSESSLQEDIYKYLIGDVYRDHDREYQNVDIAINPQDYTAEQKLVYMFDLMQARENFDPYAKVAKERFNEFFLNKDEITKDLDNAISVMADDPEVQNLLSKHIYDGYREILTTGNRLYRRDLPEEEDPVKFVENEEKRVEEVKNLRADLIENFKQNIVNGGILQQFSEDKAQNIIRNERTVDDVIKDYNSSLSFYMMVLPESTIQEYSEQMKETYLNFYKDEVVPNLPSIETILDSTTNKGKAQDGAALSPFGDAENSQPEVTTGVEELFNPTIKSMAEEYFAENTEDAERFQGNVMSLIYYTWSTAREGGGVNNVLDAYQNLQKAKTPADETKALNNLRDMLKDWSDETITEAPKGMTLDDYKKTVIRSVNTVFYGARTAYAGLNLAEGDQVSTGAAVLYAASTGINLVQAVGEAVDPSSKLLGDWAKSSRKTIAENIKAGVNGANAVSNLAWLPLEAFMLADEIKKGDKVNIALTSIGLAADTVLAVESLAAVGGQIATHMARTASLGMVAMMQGGAAIAPVAAWSMAFGVAGLVSTAAWAAYSIYQYIKDKNAFKDQTRTFEATLQRLVDDPIRFARGAFIGDPKQREFTPLNWEEIMKPKQA